VSVAGDDPVNISVVLQIVLQAERVPYKDRIGADYHDRHKRTESDR